jgi:hypothetical protein
MHTYLGPSRIDTQVPSMWKPYRHAPRNALQSNQAPLELRRLSNGSDTGGAKYLHLRRLGIVKRTLLVRIIRHHALDASLFGHDSAV